MVNDNVARLRERVAASCAKAGRDPAAVTIVAVTKGRPVEQVREVIAAGISDIGENKVQEASLKFRGLSAIRYPLSAIKWHLVGHLQTNKAKEAVRIFDLIHSVDSLRLAQELNKQAAAAGKIQDILLQIKTSPEESKSGISPDEAAGVIKEIYQLKNICLKGLMTIAPITDTQEKARPYFRMLKQLNDKVFLPCTLHPAPCTLSMGMSGDFEAAIEEGATMVRIGRAIFEG